MTRSATRQPAMRRINEVGLLCCSTLLRSDGQAVDPSLPQLSTVPPDWFAGGADATSYCKLGNVIGRQVEIVMDAPYRVRTAGQASSGTRRRTLGRATPIINHSLVRIPISQSATASIPVVSHFR